MTKTTKILNILYGLIVLLFLLDSLTSFDIKSQTLKSSVYLGLLIGTPLLFIWNIIAFKTKSQKIIWTILPTGIVIMILTIGVMKFLFSTKAWQTQTILYQNSNLSFNKVEFQLQEIGTLGYNKRKVEVFYLTSLFMITNEVPTDIEKRIEWVRVDKEVNELGLKFP